MKTFYIILFYFIISGCNNYSNILHNADVKYIEDYLCAPFKVTVSKVSEIKTDDLFYTYPKNGFCNQHDDFTNTTWKKWKDYEDPTKSLLLSFFKKYNKLNDLMVQLEIGDIYYGSCYRYFVDDNFEKYKGEDKMVFLDLNNNRLYLFEDISY